MRPATYASVLLRLHIRELTPLPKDELLALKRSIALLASIGGNINQIAKAANQGGRIADAASGGFPVSQMYPTKFYFCGFQRSRSRATNLSSFDFTAPLDVPARPDSAKGHETPLRFLSLNYNRIIVIRQIEGTREL
jgi:hypothetical protein